jgi:hypothetical protein
VGGVVDTARRKQTCRSANHERMGRGGGNEDLTPFIPNLRARRT